MSKDNTIEDDKAKKKFHIKPYFTNGMHTLHYCLYKKKWLFSEHFMKKASMLLILCTLITMSAMNTFEGNVLHHWDTEINYFDNYSNNNSQKILKFKGSEHVPTDEYYNFACEAFKAIEQKHSFSQCDGSKLAKFFYHIGRYIHTPHSELVDFDGKYMTMAISMPAYTVVHKITKLQDVENALRNGNNAKIWALRLPAKYNQVYDTVIDENKRIIKIAATHKTKNESLFFKHYLQNGTDHHFLKQFQQSYFLLGDNAVGLDHNGCLHFIDCTAAVSYQQKFPDKIIDLAVDKYHRHQLVLLNEKHELLLVNLAKKTLEYATKNQTKTFIKKLPKDKKYYKKLITLQTTFNALSADDSEPVVNVPVDRSKIFFCNNYIIYCQESLALQKAQLTLYQIGERYAKINLGSLCDETQTESFSEFLCNETLYKPSSFSLISSLVKTWWTKLTK